MSGATSSATQLASAASSACRTLATPSICAADFAAPAQPLPATRTCTSPPSLPAAATVLETLARTALPSCAATTRTDISDHSCLVAQLVDQLCDGLHLHACLALGRFLDLQGLEARRDVDSQRVRGLHIDRLLLGLHDVRQRSVARLVEAK